MKQKLIDFFNLLFGFRKFLAWSALFLVTICFRMKGYVDGAQFVDLMKSTFLAFVAGNGVEHLLTTAKDYINSKGQKVALPDDNVIEPESDEAKAEAADGK